MFVRTFTTLRRCRTPVRSAPIAPVSCFCPLGLTLQVRHFSVTRTSLLAPSGQPPKVVFERPTSAPVPGMLTLEGLKDLAAKGEIDTVVMGFTDMVGRLAGKRYDVDFFLVQNTK